MAADPVVKNQGQFLTKLPHVILKVMFTQRKISFCLTPGDTLDMVRKDVVTSKIQSTNWVILSRLVIKQQQ